MPKFELDKLVRDKLKGEYERANQLPTYRKLSVSDHKRELIRKIIEEATEIKIDNSNEEDIGEFADIQQVLNDLANLCGILPAQIESAMQAKFDKKGGFTGGIFVETIELSDGDEWVEYYRQKPQMFKEVK